MMIAAVAVGASATGIAQTAPATITGTLKSGTQSEIVTKRVIKSIGGRSVDGATETVDAIEKCGPRKFETTADVTLDGKKRRKRMLLCAKDGQGAADWAGTLEQALAKIEGNADIPAEPKAKILADLKAEIAKVRAAD
jgi:hypothetical protein